MSVDDKRYHMSEREVQSIGREVFTFISKNKTIIMDKDEHYVAKQYIDHQHGAKKVVYLDEQ